MTEPVEDRSSAMPILIALGVGLLVLGGFGISVLVNGKEMTPDLLVAKAAVGQNDALQRDNYPDFRKYTCRAEQGTESEVIGRQAQSKTAKGARFVDDVSAVSITGDKASATVTYHFEKAADNKIKVPMNFVNQDGDWKVCSPTP
jgi:hypothetical protein